MEFAVTHDDSRYYTTFYPPRVITVSANPNNGEKVTYLTTALPSAFSSTRGRQSDVASAAMAGFPTSRRRERTGTTYSATSRERA